MIGIYKIENTINGKVYIGQSKNIEDRWRSHIRASKSKNSVGYNYYIHKAFRKYGIDKFAFSVIEECPIKELNEREEYWIKQYKSTKSKFGYNLTNGGDNTANHLQRPIYQIDVDTKQIINEFKSCFEAGRYIGKSQANIRHCCDKKYHFAYGYIWRFVDDYDPSEIKGNDLTSEKMMHGMKSKTIYQLDKITDQIINEFINTQDASNKTGISRSAITNCVYRISKSAGGYKWSFKEEKGVL